MASNTYAAVGNRRDISEVITNIAPSETPIYSRIGKTKATATNHEWLEDSLGAPQANEREEGFTFATVDADPRVNLGNYTQIMERGVHVTGTQEAVLHHGVQSEMAYQMQKKTKELAMDCEQAIITQDAKIAGNMATARRFGGLPYWIITHVLDNGGAGRALTFDLVNSALEEVWNDGGKPSLLVLNPRNKRVVSTFTAGNIKHIEGGTKKLTQMIMVLETDFGILQCLTNRHMPMDTVYGLSPEYLKKAFLRNFQTVDLPKVADMHRKSIFGEWTLEVRAEKAHFAIKDLDGIVPTTP